MGITNKFLEFIIRNENSFKSHSKNASVLVIGAPDFWATKSTIKKLNIPTISESDLRDTSTLTNKQFHQYSKDLSTKLFNYLGYSSFTELDIHQRADLVYDLNYPIPEKFHLQYDLIWDIGTLEHIMNINQAMENLIAMSNLEGKIIHTQGIGDQTNAGYWTFSPVFFTDFYTFNGFKIKKMELFDRYGNQNNFVTSDRKGTPVGTIIPFHLSLAYYYRIARFDIWARLNSKINKLNNPECQTGPKLNKARQSWRILRKTLLAFIRKGLWVLFDFSTDSRPEWGIIVVAHKHINKSSVDFPIQGIYRPK